MTRRQISRVSPESVHTHQREAHGLRPVPGDYRMSQKRECAFTLCTFIKGQGWPDYDLNVILTSVRLYKFKVGLITIVMIIEDLQ